MDLQPLIDAITGLRDAVVSGVTTGVTDAFKAVLLATLPGLIAEGLLAFLGMVGNWLYDTLGPFLQVLNVVTQRPEDWTTGLDVVQEGWNAMRWLATVLLAGLFVAHLAEWMHREHGGKSVADLAERFVSLFCTVGIVQLSLEAAGRLTAAYNAILTYALGASGPTTFPGWDSLQTVPIDTPAGIGKLVYVAEVAIGWGHAVVGVAWWDVLLVLMPLALAAAAWKGSAGWFHRWSVAVVGSLVAQLALCVDLRLVRRLLEHAGAAMSQHDVGTAAVTMILGIPMLLVGLKLASMMHAGISAIHPFATAGAAAGTTKAAGLAVMGAALAPFTAGSAAAATTAATGTAAATGATVAASAPTAHVPMPVAPAPLPA